jgi:ABC-2 type transport system ATP-binding protein
LALVVEGLRKRFGEVQALDGIGFSVEPGQVFGFLGPNGAGKTTTMRIVLDIFHADEGSVTWDGGAAARAPRRTWGYLPEDRGLYPRMKVLDQLVFFGSLYGVPRAEASRRARRWLARFRVPEYADRRAEQLSKGNQQKVQFIAGILHDPDVLLMDEPFSGLDPINVALLKDAFLEMRARGKAIVFSTHQMEQVEELCDTIAIIDRGRLLVGGTVRDVRRQAGRRVVRLGVAGDPDLAWLDTMPGVRVTRPGLDYHELEVRDGGDPEAILQAALARRAYVTRFEIADPSIEDIFIERVGVSATDERTLAAVPEEPAR